MLASDRFSRPSELFWLFWYPLAAVTPPAVAEAKALWLPAAARVEFKPHLVAVLEPLALRLVQPVRNALSNESCRTVVTANSTRDSSDSTGRRARRARPSPAVPLPLRT